MQQEIYFHNSPHSFESKLIQFSMGLLGMKRRMERNIVYNKYSKISAKPPKSILEKLNVHTFELQGRTIWEIATKNSDSSSVILYLHGGAYYANITTQHWQLIEQIQKSTKAIIIIPDYPLAPESTCIETYSFMDSVYQKLISENPEKRIIFMGDSAGAGLALGFAMKIKDEDVKHPEEIILFSPWLDVSMINPDIPALEKADKILSVNGLRIAGKNYAGKLDVSDFRVSPLYGNFSNLGRISIFIGTNDVLFPDNQKFKSILENQQANFSYFEYPNLFHDWVVVPQLQETKDVINKVAKLLK